MPTPETGTWPPIIYGTAWKKNATAELVRQAIAPGYRAIDTANQPRHYNEPGVGQGIAAAMKELGLAREDLFLQSKFTPVDGHGHRIPYDHHAPLEDQIEQSFRGSLNHLNTSYLDSYLLHGPYHPRHMSDADWTVWSTLEKIYQRGDVLRIGVSNVGITHLSELLEGASIKPIAVQNRCFANTGWDRDVRALCAEHGIAYQGFSLLTANPLVRKDAKVRQLADTHNATPEQIIFAFALRVGMIPLTGTTDPQHMADDLATLEITLDDDAAAAIERIAGCGRD